MFEGSYLAPWRKPYKLTNSCTHFFIVRYEVLFSLQTESIHFILISSHSMCFQNKTISGSLHRIEQKSTIILPLLGNFEMKLQIANFLTIILFIWSTILYYTILHYTILYHTILYYTILYYIILYYTILYYTTPYYTMLYYAILYCTILYYTILYYTILYYTVLYHSLPLKDKKSVTFQFHLVYRQPDIHEGLLVRAVAYLVKTNEQTKPNWTESFSQ